MSEMNDRRAVGETRSLEEVRKEINEIDEQMAALFERRMRAAEDVFAYKAQNGLPILDILRERVVVDKNTGYIKNEGYKAYYKELIQFVMELSKRHQRRLAVKNMVGYQGVPGAFSHIALKHLFGDAQAKAYSRFEEVFRAVDAEEIACGIIPFENSYTGEVGEVFDLLYQYNCSINEIYDLQINQNLLGVKGAKLEDIKKVYSHHQALSQCKEFFDGQHFELIPYLNTALAAKYVAETGDPTKAAVASKETAALYGLDVLVETINTSRDNTTRFIVISKELKLHGNRFNLLFTLDHNAGQLAKVMQIIGKYGFNLESIKSKSLHNLPWQYYFYVEVVGDLNSDAAKQMLAEIEDNSKEIKILGVYTK